MTVLTFGIPNIVETVEALLKKTWPDVVGITGDELYARQIEFIEEVYDMRVERLQKKYKNNRTETRSLREMVTAFTATNTDGSASLDKTAREALAVKILHRWAGAEGAVSRDYWGGTSFHYTTPQKVAVVEAFQGKQWLKGQSYRNPAYSTAQNFSIN